MIYLRNNNRKLKGFKATFSNGNGTDSLKISVSFSTPCGGTVNQSIATIYIEDCNNCPAPTLATQTLNSCDNSSIDLNDGITSGANTATITFYNSKDDANDKINPIGNSVTTSGTYWVRAENTTDPTCFNTYQIVVSIATLTYTASITDENCGDSDGAINFTAHGGESPYSYSIENGANYQGDGSFSNLAGGSYTVLIKDKNDCTVSGIESIGNIGGPTVVSTTPINPTCGGECDGAITVEVTGGSGTYTYTWKDGIGAILEGNSNVISDLCAGVYSVEIHDGNCATSSTAILEAPGSDNPSFTFDNYCEGVTNGPTNIVSPGGVFTFDPAVNDGATINPVSGEITNGKGGTTYTVKYTIGDEECVQSSTQQVTVVKNPVADFEANPEVVDISNTNVDFTNSSTDASSYAWNFGDGSPVDNTINPSHTYPNTHAGAYEVSLSASNSLGCKDVKTKTIIVDSLIISYEIPNVFTPNGDGSNNEFHLISHENIKSIKVTILNRWGNEIFRSDDVDFKWNGKNQNSGGDCVDGVYFYLFKIEAYDGKEYTEHGFVTLIR